ncbi:hypothetical protein ABBQ38_002322 [Trebouxia sp. C0009 RCD-2024]
MAAVCSEIIEIVLRHLRNSLDLIACSVVSQGWYSAYQNARISCLDLSIPSRQLARTLRDKHLCGLVLWMQAQQARGNFCRLTALTIACNGYPEDSSEHYFFSGAVLMLAGTWPLQELDIVGSFDFDMALRLLPASVKHLRLLPLASCLPKIVHLASFSKFTALQTLTVHPDGEDLPFEPGNCFVLGGALANLTSMTLSNWPFLLKDGCNISTCLPHLERISVHLDVDLVNAFTSSDQFKVLFLVLDDPSPLPQEHSVSIVVERTSKLKKLVLCAQVGNALLTVIDLQVRKPGVELLCCDVILNHIGVAPPNRDNRDNYNNHRFVELDWFAA